MTPGAERRARERVNDVADRIKYADMLRAVSHHRGLALSEATWLRREADRIEGEARAALAVAMREAGAYTVTR